MTANANALRSALSAWAPKVVTAAADDVVPALKAAAPVKSGATRNGVHKGQVVATSFFATAHVSSGLVPQAVYTNDGTSPHVIAPTRSHGLLANRETGFIVSGPVNHPGSTKHRGWWDNTVLREGPAALQRAAARIPVG